MTLGETVWVDKNMRAAWGRIAEHVPKSWLPVTFDEESARTRSKGRRPFMVEEFGCGHYGCVMPTREEGLVCKLTSDISEARFVSAYLTQPKRDPAEGGIVVYKKIFGLRHQQHRGRPLFVLWRSEASDIGFLSSSGGGFSREQIIKRLRVMGFDEHQARVMREGWKLLDQFKGYAGDARNKIQTALQRHPNREEVLQAVWREFENAPRGLDPLSFNPKHYRGLFRVGITLARCAEIAMEMANTDVIYPVGAALGEYLDDGLLLADVHYRNVGLNEQRMAVITDPGHVQAIGPQWASWPEVPVI